MKLIKNIAFILIGLFVILSFKNNIESVATEESGIIFFKGTLQEAKDLAKKENKLVFLDAYASWCRPCRLMKVKTFSNKQVADFYNEHYINIAIDMEKGEGPQLSGVYKIDSYPTLIYFDSEGAMIHKTRGYHKPKEFLELGKTTAKLKQ